MDNGTGLLTESAHGEMVAVEISLVLSQVFKINKTDLLGLLAQSKSRRRPQRPITRQDSAGSRACHGHENRYSTKNGELCCRLKCVAGAVAQSEGKMPHTGSVKISQRSDVEMSSHGPVPGEITALLQRWNEGDSAVLASIASAAYDDLHNIARGYLRRESRGHTLQATGLVNELYLRLSQQREVKITDRRHFFTFSAMIMRRILSDYARRAQALKRPGAESVRIPLHPDIAWVDAAGTEMLVLDQALAELEVLDERKVRVVELRYFLGCTNQEAADLLGIAGATVERDLKFAKTWLYRRLRSQEVPGSEA